ncbi:hypothetical protein [Erythrobacter sp.]|jgi:hypothetical protein|uniref:hypothetical protein n=1 Tax=Erythrobacter sp. TaxID=1042 RepID=UPI002EB612B9|nr:hypothetical protein [Erythrobacter sp.]
MRKIVLAAAIATSALGLAACSETADEAGDMDEAMVADTEANAEAMDSEMEEAEMAIEEGAAETEMAAEEAAMEAEAEMEGED